MGEHDEWDSPIYFRVMADRNPAGGIVNLRIAEMQWFDELDYDHSHYYGDNKFESPAEAQAFIDEEIKKATALMPLILSRMGLA